MRRQPHNPKSHTSTLLMTIPPEPAELLLLQLGRLVVLFGAGSRNEVSGVSMEVRCDLSLRSSTRDNSGKILICLVDVDVCVNFLDVG